jgi:aminopeptidase N
MKKILLLSFIASLFFSCDPTKKLITEEIEYTGLDTMVISAPMPDALKDKEDYELPRYAPTYTRTNDLVHTKLDLSFDWPNQQVKGVATLTLKPYFYDTDQLELDAKGFDIYSIKLGSKALQYEYDGSKLQIQLDKTYTKKEEYTIVIDYLAKPTVDGGQSGSAAIMSDQGLFFINHDGSDTEKPMQIWTQGETEWNSRWFPTIDKPNERCTQEMILTVQDRFQTLSNGLLTSSKKNADGTRTDSYKMDLPHAPYLFMITVGEFAIVKDEWRGIPVEYYVEKKYEADARTIFAHTLEMLDFFSDKLGVKYPWPKYSQVVVRDFVSGAMENTTGVIFGEFVQLTERELIDNHNDKIVAHEMFHHWFGDLVTCESWANLTMNEGFANYSEYLWMEHKYGKDAADYHWYEEANGYFGQAAGSIHPLIYFGYRNQEDMFDAHSYNKGGCTIHMLRKMVGDDAFWAALNLYLTENKFNSVEAHDLRLAFEEVTGQDLNWFFNQWFFSAGHPLLEVDTEYDLTEKKVIVKIEQTQNTDRAPAIFQLPIDIDIYVGDQKTRRESVRMTKRYQEFSFSVSAEPNLVSVDPDHVLLKQMQDDKTDEELVFQYMNAKNFLDRYKPVEALVESRALGSADVLDDALNDNFFVIRGLAAQEADLSKPAIAAQLKKMALEDPHSQVRSAAISSLAATGDQAYLPVLKQAIEKDQAYPVIATALQEMVLLDKDEAMNFVSTLENIDNSDIIASIGNIYGSNRNTEHLDFFEKNMNKVDGYDAIDFLGNYLMLSINKGDAERARAVTKLESIALDKSQSLWRKLGATKNLADLGREYQNEAESSEDVSRKSKMQQFALELQEIVMKIKKQETNGQLVDIYQQF